MELETLKNKRNSFALLKMSFIGLLVAVTLIVLTALGLWFALSVKLKSQVYAVTDYGVMQMEIASGKESDPLIEANNSYLVYDFMSHAWNLDRENYSKNTERFTSLSGRAGEELFLLHEKLELQEKIYKDNWVLNYYQDSIFLDPETQYQQGIVYGRLKTLRPAGELFQNLYVSFTIKELNEKTSKNIYGAIVDEIDIINQENL